MPSLFNINEPIAYGMPIVFNPILAIPYILTPITIFFLLWGGYASGFLKPTYISINSMMPIGVGEFLKSMSWTNGIFPFLMIIVSMLIYFPFFKVYERQLVEKEALAEQEDN